MVDTLLTQLEGTLCLERRIGLEVLIEEVEGLQYVDEIAQVGVIPVALPVTGDPVGRPAAVARITRRRRTDAPGSSAALIGPAFRLLAEVGVFGWFIGRQRVITTLHGPERHLSFLGAPVVDVIPVSMITGNVTVAFVVLSYAGTLNVTVVADPDRCPDLDDLAEALQREPRVPAAG